MKRLYLFVLAIGFLPLPVLAQTTSEPYTFNCNALSSPSDGCKSYNEMILRKDKELIEFIDSETNVYVCFRPLQDVFVFFGFKTPGEAKYRMGSSGHLEAAGQAIYFRYSDGVLDDSKIGDGTWTKFAVKGGPAFFTLKDSEIQSSISDSEFSVSYTFPNLAHKTTNYSVSVRRSTLRFSEQYTFPKTTIVSKKDTKQALAPETDDRLSYTGYCAQIKPSTYTFYPNSPQ